LLTAYGTDRDRFEVAGDLSNLSGIAPVRIASGKKDRQKTPVSTAAGPAQSSSAKVSMSSVSAPSVTALGPKPVTKPNVIAAKVTMPLYAP